MNLFQISVSRNGRFVFRTEWHDTSTALATILAMQALAKLGYSVIVNTKPFELFQSTELEATTTIEQIRECFGL